MLRVPGADDAHLNPPTKCLSVCLPHGVNVDTEGGGGAGDE